MSFLMPKCWCKGHKATAAMAVVQLGLAMSLDVPIAWALISGTTKGTSGM
jgi:hypothetical protein